MMTAIIKRFKWFFACALLVAIGMIIQLLFFPAPLPHTGFSLTTQHQTPDISILLAEVAMFCFGFGFAEDYYRCKYGEEPCLLFRKKSELKRDKKKYPMTWFWLWITHQLKE
jgi:hypothetical protein